MPLLGVAAVQFVALPNDRRKVRDQWVVELVLVLLTIAAWSLMDTVVVAVQIAERA